MNSLITCFPSKSKTTASNSVLAPSMKTKSEDGFGYREILANVLSSMPNPASTVTIASHEEIFP